MFSIVFPGQGSQKIGMARELFDKYSIVKKLFNDADKILETSLTKIILEGPQDTLNLTENTQPAIFLTSYSIFQIAKREFGIDFSKSKYVAGHSLGEYSALSCSGSINFEDTLKILKKRGKSMQEAVPKNQGGMLAVLGSNLKSIEEIINNKKRNYECFIANDNSPQQVVISGLKKNIITLSEDLKSMDIKNIILNVSAPFHCKLMDKATEIMKEEINNLNIQDMSIPLISNVTASPVTSAKEIKKLLILQIEGRVRWLESINYMINNNTNNFIEIGPGKVLSGLIKKINKNVKMQNLNINSDFESLKLNV